MPRALSQRSLQAFRQTMLTGSASTAAATIGRSQPAVSRLLKELEHEVGFPLFDRVKGRLLPTTAATLLLEEVERSFVGLDRIAAAAGEIRNGRRGTLSVAALPAAASAILPAVAARFAKVRSGTAVILRALPSPSVVQLVLARECHLGFASAASVTPGLRVERRYRIGCMCIMPAGHHLARRNRITVHDLAGEPLVGLSPSTRLGAQLETLLDAAGCDRTTRVETHLSHLVSALVLQGIGIGVVDSVTATGHVAAGGVARPFAHPIGMEFGIIRLDETRLTGAEALFVAQCDEVLAALPDVTRLPTDAASHKIWT